MADKEVGCDLSSNLFDQRGVMLRENECLCCIDLNNKLKHALDGVSSLNVTIQLLWNELTSDCACTISDTHPSIDQDHEESTHRIWIEVNNKLRSNLYKFKKRDSLPVDQHILTSNRFTPLINLQDPTVDVNDGTVSNKRAQLHNVQREGRQTEHINVEANFIHHPLRPPTVFHH
jgi:hypothetical protein